MAWTGFLLALYVTYEMKKPAVSGSEEVDAIVFIDKHYTHELVQKAFPNEDFTRWTYFQMGNFLKEVLWQCFFQSSMAFSRLLDLPPDKTTDEMLAKLSSKNLKALQIFEFM